MRLLLTLVIVFLMAVSSFAQVPDTLWTKIYGDKPTWDGYDMLYGATPTYDGGFALNGNSTSYGDTIKGDQWVIKINASGDTLWTNTFGDFDRRDYGRDIIESYDHCLIILGHGRVANTTEDYRIRLFKADSLGNQIWDKNYFGADGLNTEKIIETSDSGFAVVGWTDETDVFLFRADSLGDSLWLKTFGGSGYDNGYDLVQTPDKGFLLVGHTTSFGAGSYDIYLIRTDQYGDTLWTKTIGTPGYQDCRAIVETHDGNYLISSIEINVNDDIIVMKIDNDGNVLWTKGCGQSDANDYAFDLAQTSDGGYLVAGRHYNLDGYHNNMYIVKLDGNGDSLWSYTLPSGTTDEAMVVHEGKYGNIYLFGTKAVSSSASSRDYYVMAMDYALDAPPVILDQLPSGYELSHNYPNPFNPQTTIQFSLPVRSDINLTVYDILGRRVKTLLNDTKAAGTYTVEWNGTDESGNQVASGIYLYRLETTDFSQSKKMLLLK